MRADHVAPRAATPCAAALVIEIDSVSMIGPNRGLSANVGLVFADSLKAWHSPDKVNTFFKSFGLKQQTFSNSDIGELHVLWQLRHSIVHTGAWLTLPDSQKVPALSKLGDKPIIFEHTFINAVARRLHKLVNDANDRLLADFTTRLGASPPSAVIADAKAFLSVTSPKPTWLK